MKRPHITLDQKHQIAGILEIACKELEITETQFNDAEQKYTSVGNWLSDSGFILLSSSSIYPQGSIKLGTTVKPLSQEEFDVDLICHIPYGANFDPADINNLVGNRLKEKTTYANLLTPLNRGWRIDYANEFHLDITPVINNPQCRNDGVLVPDKELKTWKPSNPKGYAAWFDTYSKIQPAYIQRFNESNFFAKDMEPLPEQQPIKGVLRRAVQLLKRHRDLYFQDKSDGVKKCAPISVIITTLASHAYRKQVEQGIHDNDLDLLLGVINSMPNFIESYSVGDKNYYHVMNPTTLGNNNETENFAEKWNTHPERATWFNIWHAEAINSIKDLIYGEISGLDSLGHQLSSIIGDKVSKRVLENYSGIINKGRKNSLLGMGVTGGIAVDASRKIKANTFFGK